MSLTGAVSAGVSDNSANVAVNNVISGAGTLTPENGTNIVNLGGNNTFSGTVQVSQGTLQVGNSNGLGQASSVTVNSGATLDVGGQSLFGTIPGLTITASGAGVGGSNGALIKFRQLCSQTKVFHTVTQLADTTFGGNANWDLRNSSGTSASADAS